jgi:ankyrin repeat protein
MWSSANDKLCDAAERGDVAGIERQIAAGADPNACEHTDELTPLQRAAQEGHLAAMAALLNAGARVDGANSGGWTPLMFATEHGRTVAIAALLAAGADVRRANKDGGTALHSASRSGRLDAARVLLEAGARADVRNKDGKRPIDVVRCPAGSLACSWQLHDRGTPLRRRIAMRRFASMSVTSPTQPPCARYWSGRPP